ncbi:hypothetical protein FD733_10540 [Pantoea sp. Eser]|nr:hypothetical protein [Pantoea sp. Eser]
MNAAPWQCKLRPSRLARGLQGAWLVLAVTAVLLLTLPVSGWPIKLAMIGLLLAEGWRNHWRPTQPLRWWLMKDNMQPAASARRITDGVRLTATGPKAASRTRGWRT